MPSLKKLRLRIQSISSTMKMTGAMKLVAASKLRRSREIFEKGKLYKDEIYKSLMIATNSKEFLTDDDRNLPVFSTKSDAGKIVILLFGSDRGLCGNFNNSIILAVKSYVASLAQNKNNITILATGKKIQELAKQLTGVIVENIELRAEEDFSKLSNGLLAKFQAGEIAQCHAFYNHFLSLTSQKVIKINLLPIFEEKEKSISERDGNFMFMPNADLCIKQLLPRALNANILLLKKESLVSEHSARMTSMDNANRNAKKMIKNVRTTYNRTRQNNVTKELLEIISGSEAISHQ